LKEPEQFKQYLVKAEIVRFMQTSIFWFRRDLRLEDNVGLFHALRSGHPVVPIFIFDPVIIEGLPKTDLRLSFIHQRLHHLQARLYELGSSLLVVYKPIKEAWRELLTRFSIAEVYTNHDYEPYAVKRDLAIEMLLYEHGIPFFSYRDQVIFEKQEVLTGKEKPYTVFTPYSKKWKSQLSFDRLQIKDTESLYNAFWKTPIQEIISLEAMGFQEQSFDFPSDVVSEDIVRTYGATRDFPSQKGTTRMGVHLRFGTVSIRQLVQKAINLKSNTYLNELIWREFYMQILWNFPHVVEKAFKPDYDTILWRNDTESFERWKEGKTGYPLVDAGMRELNETGYMHNRVRMVVASFLTKHLLIDWRWGEAYFAEKLLDFELASNNGGWQWAAGSGCDAAPYFRVFNPESQMKKFDKGLKYIMKWVPEYGTPIYSLPIVEHKFARNRAINTYKQALAKAKAEKAKK